MTSLLHVFYYFRTSTKEAKFTRLCERIANFEQHIRELCESALKMRKERPLMVRF